MKLKKIFFVQIIIIVLLLFPTFSVNANTIEPNELFKIAETHENEPLRIAETQPNNTNQSEQTNSNNSTEKKELNIYAKSCILVERSTNLPVYEKNADERLYPASTTKLLTAILAVENCHMDDVVTITYEMTSKVPAGYTSAYLRPGEKVTVEELLNSLLIPSGNDAGFALAIHISGSVDEFANLMNKKSTEIGCTNSHFTNPSGIQNLQHYSTARDLSKIGLYAMNYPQITSIVCKTSYTLHPNQRNMRTFETTNTLIKPSSKTYYEYATGLKTGFTDEAGACLISSAKKDNMEYIAVVLGDPEPKLGLSYRDLDCKTLFEYGFENYDEFTKVDLTILNLFTKGNPPKISITMIYKIALGFLVFILLLALISIVKHKKRKKKNKKK